MAKTITQINTATDTFQVWVDQTNEAINAISTECVTANNTTTGGVTVGNAYVNGIFCSVNLVCTTLRGGNVDTTANLSISSNVDMTGEWLRINTDVELTAINVQTSGTGAQIVDFFDLAVYRGAEYLITIDDNGANANQIEKLLIVHDVGNGHVTDYGVVWTNNQLGTFSSNANSTHIRLLMTPSVTNTQVKAKRTLIRV